MKLPVDWGYLERRFKEENVTQKDVSKLLGHHETYLAMYKTKGEGLPNAEIEKLRDLMEIDMKLLIPKSEKRQESTEIDALIQEIGILRNRIVQLEKKMEEPQIVAIPMDAKEMAVRIMGELLESGWCTKDDVLKAFTKHHIAMQYMQDALTANDAITATAGHGGTTRTFIIKGGVEV